MRDHRRHIRPVGHPSGDSGEFKLTKAWYERPLSKRVKAVAALLGVLSPFVGYSIGAWKWTAARIDEKVAQIVRRENATIVASQQASDRLNSERIAAVKVSIDTMRLDVKEIRSLLEKQKKKKGAHGEP